MNKQILVADFMFYEAHKMHNAMFIKALSKMANINVVSLNGYYDEYASEWSREQIGCIQIELKKEFQGTIGARIRSLEIMKKTMDIVKRNRFDMIVVLAFDTVVFSLHKIFFSGTKISVFHHINLDELHNNVKKWFFNRYKNSIVHLVFEEEFAEYLINTHNVSDKKVYIIPHPIKEENYTKPQKQLGSYDCVGLCMANSEEIIRDLLNKNEVLRKNGIKVLMRSREEHKSLSNVTIINGFLEKEVYDNYINSARYIFLATPDTYRYRLSGSMYDALSKNKPVLTTNKFYANEYEKKYPGLCIYVNNADELINYLVCRSVKNINDISLDLFKQHHCLLETERKLSMMIREII